MFKLNLDRQVPDLDHCHRLHELGFRFDTLLSWYKRAPIFLGAPTKMVVAVGSLDRLHSKYTRLVAAPTMGEMLGAALLTEEIAIVPLTNGEWMVGINEYEQSQNFFADTAENALADALIALAEQHPDFLRELTQNN